MEGMLCDELLQEIMRRLPASARPAASLVSKRWLTLLRSSIPSLSLCLPCGSALSSAGVAPISSILSRYSSLSTLTLVLHASSSSSSGCPNPSFSSDAVLLSLSDCASSHLPHLRHLRLLAGPVSTSVLSALPLSSPLRRLASLQLSSLRPLSFRWLLQFPFLRDLSIHDCSSFSAAAAAAAPSSAGILGGIPNQQMTNGEEEEEEEAEGKEIALNYLSLAGIRAGDHGVGWLWRRCPNLQRLHLRSCEGTGDGPSSRFFALCLQNLREVELRTCRAIADTVLLLIADHCRSLSTLVLYDGGSRDGLHHFIRRCGSALRTLDLRLPLDLDNGHLSCCLITGDGLRSLARAAAGAAIEELVLVNCDVVEREPGLLTFLGQSLRRLRKLDLSHNELLLDKELGAMLASCGNLVEIKLRGCKGLTDAVMPSIFRFCALLEALDVTRCQGISAKGVEFLILSSPRLRQIHVEEAKVSESAYIWASRRMIQVY
ncbi:unnamed protein product [Spirodela intermedia]|uniref:F-box domain-containing protein n=1 Tax=Spirodela intermedia TaxID=51605 RepID=A0A7I8JCT0_SPIIN|nr:unnamed protein product [Spirodela intermedia]CAA6667986.1 unnamed protein product [Spirodela intermedia]